MMCFDNLAGDSKPKACTSGLVSYKGAENLFHLRSGHTAAVVSDRNRKTAGNSRGSNLYHPGVWVLNGLLGVTKEIQKCLSDLGPIQVEWGMATGNTGF